MEVNMTVSELYSQVSALGFESSLESDTIFYNAALRAVLEVNRVRPRTASALINHIALENLTEDVFSPRYVKGSLEFIGVSPKSAYFEADGDGRVFFESAEDGAVFYEMKLSRGEGFTAYRVVLPRKEGPVVMRFTGDYLYSVRNVAMYGELLGPSESDVPVRARYTAYDMKNVVGDFLEFNQPLLAVGEDYINPAGDYAVEEKRVLLLPYDKPGTYKVIYKRTPRKIDTEESPAGSGEVIDLDEELSALLAPLIASYVYAEDEPSLAEYYLSLYRQSAAEIRATARQASVVRMRNANNW